MGKPTVINNKAASSRADLGLAKKRTNAAAEEEKGTSQQNIKSYFGLKGRSQLWTTIDSQCKGKKKNLKLSTRKGTIQSKTESPYFVHEPELKGSTSLEKHHSPSVVHMHGYETDNSKQKGYTKILETKTMVEPEILQELALDGKYDMECRNKNASLAQEDKCLLKGKSTPNGSNCDSRAYTDTNYAFLVNDVSADEDSDFIPPTPSPVGRHSFINCQIQQLGKEGVVSLMENCPLIHDSKDVSKKSAISNISKETRLEDLYETTGVIEQSTRLHKNGIGTVDTAEPLGLDKSLTCEDTEQSFLSPSKSQSIFKTSKKRYKLARKGNSSRVLSSPLKPCKSYGSALKSLHCQKGVNENDIPDQAEPCSVTIVPSKCVILRSRIKRPAVKGSSPAQKRQQTEMPLAKNDEAKCNLWSKLGEMQFERDNISGYLSKNLKLYNNTSKNPGDTEDVKSCVTLETTCKLLQKEGTAITSAGSFQNPLSLEGSNYCHAGKKHKELKKEEVEHGATYIVYNNKERDEALKLKSPFKTKVVKSKSSNVCKDFVSPLKANSPQLNGHLDTSVDSLADAVDLDSLLAGVEWSPMVISPNKLETSNSSSSKACKALFVPSKSEDQIETTSDCAPCTGTAPAFFTSEVGYGRFLVLEVSRRETIDEQVIAKYGRQLPEKVLRLFDEAKSQEWFCCLREDWEMTEVEPGDIVHITGSFDLQNEMCILDNATDRYIVVHPDSLISGTTVSMATKCLRQSVLNERFRTENQNEAMLIGTLLHDIFDMAMEFNEFLAEKILSRASELLQKFSYLNDLYSIGKTENWALEKVKEYIPQFSEWGRKFKGPFPQPDLGVMDYKTPGNPKDKEEPSVCVSALKDIEENIWSPRFGLKGKVDVTVEVKVDRRPKIRRHKPDTGNQVQTKVVPLELKTGKMFSKLGSVEHRAQVILYTLLMSDRYSESVDSGLLLYMKAGHMLGVPAFLHEKRALVMKRNEVARFMTLNRAGATRAMPAMLRDLNTCRRCSQAQNCTVFHKAVEAGDNLSSGLGTFFDEMTGHMTGTYMKYFADWFRLVCLEGKELEERRRQSEIWCIESWAREKLGRCFSRMALLPCNRGNMVVIGRYLWHRFVRTDDHPSAVSLQDVPITSGDRVVVSEEHGQTVALAAGYIHEVTKKHVTVLLDRDLNKRYNSQADFTNSKLYRLDKDDEYNTLTTLWSNMARLFKGDSDRDGELRRQIIDLQPPVFSRKRRNDTFKCLSQSSDIGEFFSQQSPSQRSCSQSAFDPAVESILQELNTGQRKAVSKALCAQHYALILGMPGTGKTTTISCLVRVLVASGKTVLLTSYTHTAVDNILLKLKEAKLDFLRLGQVHKILPELQPYSAQKAAESIKTVDELRKFYESKSVVATTCLGVNHALFSQHSFDYCIVDEASQITQPVCIGPLRHARVFILVGDHYQLPPLVQSVEAREGGMDVSLFKRLSERHPQAVITLKHQYRMNGDIMELSNTLIYEQRLKCGTQGVARAMLEIPNWEELVTYVKTNTICMTETWLLDALDPKRSVVFLDTDKIPAPENRSEDLVCNEIEAFLVHQLACALLQGGVTPVSLGIISPYRHQLKLITEILKKGSQPRQSEIEINTVDKYQGRDKSCIIVSLVRSNEHNHVGDLLRDWRRVNVAVTRAKQKLILIGSLTTLKGSLLLREMFDLLERRDWVQVLPCDAHKMNPFVACPPQASPICSLKSQSNCLENSSPLISC